MIKNKNKQKLDITHRFIDVVQNNNTVFIGHLDSENYIEIEYVGWNHKGVKSYKIQIWRDECGCIHDEIKRFKNINDAILYAVENTL